MKKKNFIKVATFCFFALLFILNSCKDDEVAVLPIAPVIPSLTSTSNGAIINELLFSPTVGGDVSTTKSFTLKAANLLNSVEATVAEHFEISKNNADFSNSLTLTATELNVGNFLLYVRFSPTITTLGEITGELLFTSDDFIDVTVNLKGNALEIPREIQIAGSVTDFGEVTIATNSVAQVIQVKGLDLENDVTATVTGLFEISKDNITYSNNVNYTFGTINTLAEDLHIRFIPGATDLGVKNGVLTFTANGVDDVVINLSGTGIPLIHNYSAFQDQRIAFGGGYNQTETGTFNLHNDLTNIENIKMYIKLRCPSGGCNAWDVFANIKVKDISSGDWYEIGRYITPYGIDNSAVTRGFEVDVTDFKSLLSGSVELYARIETWGADGWELSVDFDYIEGTPDYPYYAVADVISYDDWSTSGVPYGVTNDPMVWDLDKSITIPANSEATSLRTIISGWGHATPTDSDGRPCAEWCYRTHDVKINGANTFQHYMGPIGCGANPVSGQAGNWAPDRAGWCPGMAVPVRVNEFATAMAGNTVNFEYDYENWVTDGGNTSGNSGAYYATSTFVIVKSNTPITKPIVN